LWRRRVTEAEATREVRVEGARIVYDDAGAGEPLLLLHGDPQSRVAWRHQISVLARTHRVLAPDWLGWGESDRPLDLSFRHDDEVRRIRRFLDAVGVGRASIAAHDYGAHLALGLATRAPDLPRRVLAPLRDDRRRRPRCRPVAGTRAARGDAPAVARTLRPPRLLRRADPGPLLAQQAVAARSPELQALAASQRAWSGPDSVPDNDLRAVLTARHGPRSSTTASSSSIG
jgi:pimeloyl-ACP methyl ester carboxylesterase